MQVFNHKPWGEAWTVDTAGVYLHDLWNTPHASGVVAEAGGNVIGFALGHAEQRDNGRHFYLSEMCVLAEHQGRGVGKGMIIRLEAELKGQGIGKMYLLTARGGAAEAFYHACGFYSSEKMAMLGKYL